MRKLSGIFLFMPFFCLSQGTWEKIDLPVQNILRSVCFTDSLYGWVAGDSGVILHTTDGGSTWNIQESGSAYDIYDIFFLERNLGWASAMNYVTPPYGTLLLKTTDGGATWTSKLYPQEDIFINCILFTSPVKGWMGGSPHAIVSTTDGGATWHQAAVDSSVLSGFPVISIAFYNERHGYACGGMFDIAGVIWNTHDSGKTWQAIDIADAPADEVRGLHLFDSLRVIGAGGDPDFGYGVGMIRTFDGGLNWDYDELGIQGTTYDIDFRTPSEAWAPLGSKRTLIFTLDTGNTWTEIATAGNTMITDITFPDSIHGYAVGREGAFLRYKAPFHPGISPSLPQPEKAGMKWLNVPGSAVMNYELEIGTEGIGKIDLLDDLGRVVATVKNEKFYPGEYVYSYDMNNLRNGVYFARLKFSSPSGSREIVIIRKIVLMR